MRIERLEKVVGGICFAGPSEGEKDFCIEGTSIDIIKWPIKTNHDEYEAFPSCLLHVNERYKNHFENMRKCGRDRFFKTIILTEELERALILTFPPVNSVNEISKENMKHRQNVAKFILEWIGT